MLTGQNVLMEQKAVNAVNKTCAKIMSTTRTLISINGPEPSAPGEPPHRQTGNLLNSIQVGKLVQTPTKVTRSVGANPDTDGVGYAAYLEYGTSTIKPRPYLSVASMDAVNDLILNILNSL